jgi:type VI secretion system lysozyme-like protein
MISLLSRLQGMTAEPSEPRGPTESGKTARLREDVLRNLRHLCGTRFGSAPCSPAFGIADLSDIFRSGEDPAALISRSLQRAIQAHEPRLMNVQVNQTRGAQSDLVLRFEIRGQLVADGGRTQVLFETRIDPSRRVMIR